MPSLWLAVLGAVVALMLIFKWAGWFDKPKPKQRKHWEQEDEDFRIDPANVPEFKPTWQKLRREDH
jgi:hypothetical protein